MFARMERLFLDWGHGSSMPGKPPRDGASSKRRWKALCAWLFQGRSRFPELARLACDQCNSSRAALDTKRNGDRWIQDSIGVQTPPAALERKAASTIATPAKPSSMVGKVSAGSAREAVRRAKIAVATSV